MAAKLAILAGGGDLPGRLVRVCRESGRPLFLVAVEGQTDPALCEGLNHVWTRLGNLSRVLPRLHAEGVREIVLAGRIRRPSLSELRPDARTLKLFLKVGGASLGDDGLLRRIVAFLEEEEGLTVRGVDELLEDLIAYPGAYGALRPDREAESDIARGAEVARALGRVDVGQAVVVQQGVVLAVEAAEGTDELIARCAGLRRPGPRPVLVKLRKPQQERRVDLPTIGPVTLEKAAAAGFAGIAVEAGGTLVLERDRLGAMADQAGLFLVGLELPS